MNSSDEGAIRGHRSYGGLEDPYIIFFFGEGFFCFNCNSSGGEGTEAELGTILCNANANCCVWSSKAICMCFSWNLDAARWRSDSLPLIPRQMGSCPPKHSAAGRTRSSLSCFSQRCLKDVHDLPEKFLLVPSLGSQMSCPPNHVVGLQPDFHIAMRSVYKRRPNYVTKSQPLIRGERLRRRSAVCCVDELEPLCYASANWHRTQ